MSNQEEYAKALTHLSMELSLAYEDVKKWLDPKNITDDVMDLQKKIATGTLEVMTQNVKNFRSSLEVQS